MAESFVRQFALTGKRAKATTDADLALDTLVLTTPSGDQHRASTMPEQATILEMALDAVSIAEIGARLKVHAGIARVLVADLAVAGHVTISSPEGSTADGPDLETLERLLDDLYRV